MIFSDATADELGRAQSILQLIEPPKPPEVQQLVDIIYALSILEDFGS